MQVGLELLAQVGAGKAEGHGGLQEARLRATVIALAAEAEAIDAAAAYLGGDGVGQLDLAADTFLLAVEVLQHSGA